MTPLRIFLGVVVVAIFGQLFLSTYLLGYGSISGVTAIYWIASLFLVPFVIVGLVISYFWKFKGRKIWKSGGPKDPLQEVRTQAKYQFSHLRTQARSISHKPMSVTWNLFLAAKSDDYSTTMDELNYRPTGEALQHDGLTVTTWSSPTAVAYRIEIDPDQGLDLDLLTVIFKLIFTHRRNLAVNAAFVEYDLASLTSPANLTTDAISSFNKILNQAYDVFGLEIPIHFVIPGLEKMPDLHLAADLSGAFDDQVVWGGFLDKQITSPSARIDRLFQDFIRTVSHRQLSSLQRMSETEPCAAIVNTPLQLDLIRAQANELLLQLIKPIPPKQNHLDLHSIAFVGASQSTPTTDPLAQLTGQRFFQEQPHRGVPISCATSVTADSTALLANAYHQTRYFVKQNDHHSARINLKSKVVTVLLSALVISYGVLSWKNVSDYRGINASTMKVFEDYQNKADSFSSSTASLAGRILLLGQLRQSLDAYQSLDMSRYRKWLPGNSMLSVYANFYNQELEDGLTGLLSDNLQKRMVAANARADDGKLMDLLIIADHLNDGSAAHAQQLAGFFTRNLVTQGEISTVFHDRSFAVLQDLFQLNRPITIQNEQLHQSVVRRLSKQDPEGLLYAALMQSPKYADPADLRSQVSSKFSQVFAPIADEQSYLVPRAYTRGGFADLFEKDALPDLAPLLADYQNIIEPLNATQINGIMTGVAERYASDYIATWDVFLRSLSIATTGEWSNDQILIKSLTSTTNNPVMSLVNALDYNVGLTEFKSLEDSAEDKSGSQGPVADIQAQTADKIHRAFTPYLSAAASSNDSKTQFDLFLQYTREASGWLAEATSDANNAGRVLFEKFQAEDQANPLSKLNTFAARSELELISKLGRNISASLNDAAMQQVYGYIDSQWQQQILQPYGRQLRDNFPFNRSSRQDLSLQLFTQLFMGEGDLQNFENTYLSRFKSEDGTYTSQANFLVSGGAQLSDQAVRTLDQLGQIRDTFFVGQAPALSFKVRASYLNNLFSNLTISSGPTLYQYRHGPLIWSEQNWPASGTESNGLRLQISGQGITTLEGNFEGLWSWFRLAYSGTTQLDPSNGIAKTSLFQRSIDNQPRVLNMVFQANSRFNPFSSNFFSRVNIPNSLFFREKHIS
ncbi:hypothetical protein GCM10007094_44240 [Pseudovibrio japonicus]|uniref:Type VI secretion protein IcmF n=1 Tax=Pseudovibrio japonicus TaxID=366534 RepID=A0ABQ3EU19_9HYPH|nr:ImcF-related family protein [Pseudovibrio japonicus]GHB50126.1 hypothetical protein GCM10007094_44240 [Pseudovibrio japonicus]